jgi:phenylalanyl-tRNA synthetase alpha chain
MSHLAELVASAKAAINEASPAAGRSSGGNSRRVVICRVRCPFLPRYSTRTLSSVAALDNVRVEYLGKKGHLTLQMTTLRELPPEERPHSAPAVPALSLR